MRRLLLLAAMVGMVLLVAAPAFAQSRGPSGADGSYNCPDFDTSEQAQTYYDGQGGLAGGDPDGLDRDSDGLACEDSLPSGGETDEEPETFTDPNPEVGDTCPEGFAAFGDPGTGELTCVAPDDPAVAQYDDELLESSGDLSAPTETPTEAPVATETYSELPDTGGPSMLLPLGALLVGAGVVAYAVIRRR